MGKLIGGLSAAAGILLWYYGGTRGLSSLVNLGIGAIILGMVLSTLSPRGYVDREALTLSCSGFPHFLDNLKEELGLRDGAVIIPPFENLPRGGIFLPESEEFSLRLGKLDEKSPLVTGSGDESGLLISPPPGWGIIEYTLENVGEIRDTGVGYASSAVSSVLSALGLGSGEAFEEGDKIEVYAEPICDGPFYADPVASAMLIGVAMGKNEVLAVKSAERVKGYWRIVLEPLGGVKRWL